MLQWTIGKEEQHPLECGGDGVNAGDKHVDERIVHVVVREPRIEEHAPFCSQRGRDRDLAHWYGDSYAVPGRPAAPEEIAGEVIRGKED